MAEDADRSRAVRFLWIVAGLIVLVLVGARRSTASSRRS